MRDMDPERALNWSHKVIVNIHMVSNYSSSKEFNPSSQFAKCINHLVCYSSRWLQCDVVQTINALRMDGIDGKCSIALCSCIDDLAMKTVTI